MFTSSRLGEPLLPAARDAVDIHASFRAMHVRKLQRYLYGLALRRSAVAIFWVVAYIGALAVGLLLSWTGTRGSFGALAGRWPHASVSDFLTATVLCVVMLGTAVPNILQVDAVWRWATYWTYILALTLVLTQDFAGSDELRIMAAISLIVVEALTFCVWGLLQHILPELLLRLVAALDARMLWHLEAQPTSHASTGYTFTYKAKLLGCISWPGRSTRTCSYVGGVASHSGRPHGYGEWLDDSFRGERLHGYWDDGVPIAPFRSREFGSGHAFACVRIAYVANHAYAFDRTSVHVQRFQPERALRCGVADVECAVSGQYFRHFPKATPGDESTAGPSSVAAAIAHALRSMARSSPAAVASGGRPAATESDSEVATEAIIYLPGFNTSLSLALQRLGQLLALADLPEHFRSFVFSWPGGRAMSYLAAMAAVDDPRMADDLGSLLRALRDNGVRKVHMLAHSMGARLLLQALPTLSAMPLIASGGLTIANVVLLSPDVPLQTFHDRGVPRSLEALGGRVTVYGDRHDRPLSYSETFHWLCNPRSDGWRSLGRLNGAPWTNAPRIDVVDTTWMQAGQPAGDPDIAINMVMRHSHFMINTLFVDDLVELLVSGKAAEHRTRQLRRRDGSDIFHLDVGASIE